MNSKCTKIVQNFVCDICSLNVIFVALYMVFAVLYVIYVALYVIFVVLYAIFIVLSAFWGKTLLFSMATISN